MLSTLIAQISKARMSGSLIAAIFTVGGFALFGKNIYNVISIVLGVYLYSLIRKENFSKLITVALFGTSLAPVVNQLSFGMNLNPLIGIALGNIVGIFIGLVLAPLAASFVKFHQGFNLYNIGFTTGIVGMFLMSLFRSTGYNHEIVSNVYLKTDITLTVFLIFYFISMAVFGIIFVKNNFSNYSKLLNTKIKAATDFVELGVFSLVLLNMGVLGIISTIIVLIFKAPLNGPLVGGIFTVVGFGAFVNILECASSYGRSYSWFSIYGCISWNNRCHVDGTFFHYSCTNSRSLRQFGRDNCGTYTCVANI